MRPTNTNYANIAFGGVFFAFYARALSICMIVFKCVLASLHEGLSARPSVGPSVSIKEKTPKSTKISTGAGKGVTREGAIMDNG